MHIYIYIYYMTRSMFWFSLTHRRCIIFSNTKINNGPNVVIDGMALLYDIFRSHPAWLMGECPWFALERSVMEWLLNLQSVVAGFHVILDGAMTLLKKPTVFLRCKGNFSETLFNFFFEFYNTVNVLFY